MNYWRLEKHPSVSGFDGASWIIEGFKNGQYHYVEKWSPEYGEFMMKFVVDENHPAQPKRNIPDLRKTLKLLKFEGMVCVKSKQESS